jgi:hypothetical protein
MSKCDMLPQIVSAIDVAVDDVPKTDEVEVIEVPEIQTPMTTVIPETPETTVIPEAPETTVIPEVTSPDESIHSAVVAAAVAPTSVVDKLKHAGKTVALVLFVIPCKSFALIMQGKFTELGSIWKEEQEAVADAVDEVTHLV